MFLNPGFYGRISFHIYPPYIQHSDVRGCLKCLRRVRLKLCVDRSSFIHWTVRTQCVDASYSNEGSVFHHSFWSEILRRCGQFVGYSGLKAALKGLSSSWRALSPLANGLAMAMKNGLDLHLEKAMASCAMSCCPPRSGWNVVLSISRLGSSIEPWSNSCHLCPCASQHWKPTAEFTVEILAFCSNLPLSNPVSDTAVGSLTQGIASVKLYASALAVLWRNHLQSSKSMWWLAKSFNCTCRREFSIGWYCTAFGTASSKCKGCWGRSEHGLSKHGYQLFCLSHSLVHFLA